MIIDLNRNEQDVREQFRKVQSGEAPASGAPILRGRNTRNIFPVQNAGILIPAGLSGRPQSQVRSSWASPNSSWWPWPEQLPTQTLTGITLQAPPTSSSLNSCSSGLWKPAGYLRGGYHIENVIPKSALPAEHLLHSLLWAAQECRGHLLCWGRWGWCRPWRQPHIHPPWSPHHTSLQRLPCSCRVRDRGEFHAVHCTNTEFTP